MEKIDGCVSVLTSPKGRNLQTDRTPTVMKTENIMLDISTLPALVDEMTALNTQIAVLTARADSIKKDLISTGLSEVCGSNTRAVISKIASGYTTDWHSVADYLKAPAEVIALFQKERAGYTKVEVKGFNARKVA